MQPDLQPQRCNPTTVRAPRRVSYQKLPVKRHRGSREPGTHTGHTGHRSYRYRVRLSVPTSNLNHGQDTRANRTRHTTRSSTQPHAKQQLTNATQTQLTFTRTHTSPGRPHRRRDHRRCSPRRDRDAVRVARRSARRGVLRPHGLRRVAHGHHILLHAPPAPHLARCSDRRGAPRRHLGEIQEISPP